MSGSERRATAIFVRERLARDADTDRGQLFQHDDDRSRNGRRLHRRKPQAPAQDAGQRRYVAQDYDCRTAHLCKAFAGGCAQRIDSGRMPSRPSCLAGYLLKLPPRGDSRFAVSVPLRSGAKGGSVSCPVSYLSTFYYLYPLETKRYDL